MSELTVIVLAAGGGTRMKSKTPKMLHQIAGRSLVGHVLAAVSEAGASRVVAVVGHQRELVEPHIAEILPEAVIAVQTEQLGTAHAVRVAVEAGAVSGGTVLVTYGDTPLLRGESLRALVADHESAGRAATILSGIVPEPFGYGRILRGDGGVSGIVEEKDATDEERAITEINSGIIAFDGAFLAGVLPRIGNDNAKKEFYLTDAIALAVSDGLAVDAFVLDDVTEAEGANDRAQLAALGKILNDRIVTRWMKDGVTVMDPATTWIDADVELAPDVTILPGTQLIGATRIDEDAVVGPDCTLKDTEVGHGARVVRTQAELAVVGPGANVGPFSYLRPGTVLGEEGKIGGFVEVKNSTIGPGAKVPHLSYVGDATIGEGSNIGAGTIFANYDGVNKHKTRIGRHVKSGSGVTFVAPVVVGDGATTGGEALIREDVPPGALAVSAGQQRIIEGWALAKRAGTPQAAAAEEALEAGVPILGEPSATGE
ncbi:bifunctional UDP-N-acetylglucosamine diphosphorylase/glucosamine-1-phosphate N-acetyltransferase GlmU [Nocardioides sp. WG-D5]|uniref:bifunctional UDP-N-acetylglucosamine diphosphorylase/glucosamine-1-phosphate N-acetyltransferase GlmU n=1 Tax=Nocardioides luteus TaxID=1844 RepID=UPI0002029281|nr:bifunctional UDP-N-acetylglucosamine diphosphorylase/glucosamine-1-phosphate N-acetyltransferase GlmU [Nocardioides luteus]EGD42062.1 UDP-N-acetylglucosamine diphosphorylase/glucosamine-1-phosphate N-acetyltransferase [Nocardioidaceae bacterium Broad-1]MBG6094812.1 bifunctional UDP-N-acetylglucosamine pyrophosphorylase/glucosamine-1-phosphate N-acetyltransferase [Nocardioides luteus]